MQVSQELRQSEGVVFIKSLERMLGRLMRLLVGRISLVRLQEMIRKTYLQEAERKLKADFPGKRMTMSQLALLTGLDTRTLTHFMNSEGYSRPIFEDPEFLAEMTLETRVISTWLSDPRFFDHASGKPLELNLKSGRMSFNNLVATAISARGLTAQTILNRLESAGAIEIDELRARVRLIDRSYYPFLSNDEAGVLDVGFSTVATLLQTVMTNLEQSGTLFQRSSFTHRLSPKRLQEFRRRMRGFLEKSDSGCATLIEELEDRMPLPGQITAGVSMFYFEESPAV